MRYNKKIPLKKQTSIALVADGPCEQWYFNMVKRNEPQLSFTLKPEIPQNKSIQEQFEKVMSLIAEYDKIIWVIDLDVVIKESKTTEAGKQTPLQKLAQCLKRIETFSNKNKKNKDRITVINNNPCLEFWLLLHFEKTGRYYDNCDNANKQLKKYLPDYEKTQAYFTRHHHDIYLKTKDKLPMAIANAKALPTYNLTTAEIAICEMYRFFEMDEIKSILL